LPRALRGYHCEEKILLNGKKRCNVFTGHSPQGLVLTLRNYQAERPSFYDLEAQLGKLAIPTLLVIGDEDSEVIEVNLFLKRTIPNAGLWVLPRTGHSVNLEEPVAYNAMLRDFFTAVERQCTMPP
jgi:pimeloyl-ACP methyl ester carboxylesterase